MKPLLLAHSDIQGGASRATFRLHKAFMSADVDSRMRVAEKKSDLSSVDGSTGGKLGAFIRLLRPSIAALPQRLQKTRGAVFHSTALLPSGLVDELNRSNSDVLNLHWINSEFLSINDIAKLRKPLVWTLHDMWAFCGSEHYSSDDNDARWRVGYCADNRPPGYAGLDIDRWVWRRKLKAWRRPAHLVTPSRWLANCVKASAIMHEWPVTVVPNPIDTQQYRPWPKALARQLLGLPATANLVVFGAIGGGQDLRKGWDLLQPALEYLAAQQVQIECVIFGQSAPAKPPYVGLPLHWMGHLHDDVTLALLYSAADVVVVPSRQENLPQSGTEAHACGCPVVAFDCTGLPDVVVHGETGYLARPYDIEDLAHGIRWVLEDSERHVRLRMASRNRAMCLWSPGVVVPQYIEVYETAIGLHQKLLRDA